MGILYGCPVPFCLEDAEADLVYDLISRWEKHAQVNLLARDERRVRNEHPEGTDTDLIGVWVAVGGSGEDGAPYLGEHALRVRELFEKLFDFYHPDIACPSFLWASYADSVASADALWQRFVKYCKDIENIDIPRADLWLISCEVA